jgi:hypothetical protein
VGHLSGRASLSPFKADLRLAYEEYHDPAKATLLNLKYKGRCISPIFQLPFSFEIGRMKLMTKKAKVLKLTVDDAERELEFEIDYLSSLTFEERLKMMREKSREMLKQMIEHGHRRPFEIIKRT